MSGNLRSLGFRLIQPYLDGEWDVHSVAAEAKLSVRTAQRWANCYKRAGLSALARKPNKDRGARGVVLPKTRAANEGLAFERPTLPVRPVDRHVRQFAETCGEPVPGYETVCDLVRQLPTGLLTLVHLGAKTYGETFHLVHRREAVRPNAIWQADHAQLSICSFAWTVRPRGHG